MNPSAPRILVVDDDTLCSALIRAVLTRAGHAVTLASDGAAALTLTEAEPPDMVLLDFMMPGLSGPEVAARMRGQRGMGEVPILLLSATDDGADIEAGRRAGINDYLRKPIDRKALLARVEEALRDRGRAPART